MRIAGGGPINAGTSTGRSTSVTCEVENLNSLRFCDQSLYDIPLQTNFKMSGSYPVPFCGLRLSGMFQSLPGTERAHHLSGDAHAAADADRGVGERAAERTGHASTTSASTSSISVWRRASSAANVDVRPQLTLFNALNVNPATTVINVYGSSLDNISAVLNPRLLQLGVTVKF